MAIMDLSGCEDEPQVWRLLAEAQIHRDPGEVSTRAPTIAHGYRETGRMRLWGWGENGVVLGLIGIEGAHGDGIVRDLAVDPATRGRGVGRTLLEHAKRQYGSLQGDTLTEAAGFYRRCGFQLTPTHALPDGRKVLRFSWSGEDPTAPPR